ncbi:MAG: helix-turn-helix transcriptional regulator [Saprospiraceae bacterium]|nr:helix-turn-helix transcriptional regulator [Saprospiraceae bacterium]
MTLFGLSDVLKISKSAISDYENSKSLPGLDVVQKFSTYFDIPIDDLYNSDITEIYKKTGKIYTKEAIKTPKGNTEDIAFENEKYIFSIKLLTQKLESTQLQIQMLKQLLESREAENKTLKINIKLLEEQLKNFDKLVAF